MEKRTRRLAERTSKTTRCDVEKNSGEMLAMSWSDTKLSMLSIIEQDLQLKLEIQDIKKNFIQLLVDFEEMACNQTEPSRTKARSRRIDPFEITRQRLKAKFCDEDNEVLIGSPSSKQNRISKEWKHVKVGCQSSINNLSQIRRMGESSVWCTPHVTASDGGPLHSTLMSEISDSVRTESEESCSCLSSVTDSIHDGSSWETRGRFETRPGPMGVDNIHHKAPPAIERLLPKSLLRARRLGASVGMETPPSHRATRPYSLSDTSDEADESTPIVAYRSRRVSVNYCHSGGIGSGRRTLLDTDSPTQRFMPRERYLIVSDDGSRANSTTAPSSDRHSSEYDMSSSEMALIPRDERVLVGRSLTEEQTGLTSMEASRDSEAHASILTTPNSDTVSSVDPTSSRLPLSCMTSNDSSLKESDGQYSSLAHAHSDDDDDFDFVLRMPASMRHRKRSPLPSYVTTTSPASLSSVPSDQMDQGDHAVPVNSPNSTNSECSSLPVRMSAIQGMSASTLDSIRNKYLQASKQYTTDGVGVFTAEDNRISSVSSASSRPPVIGKEATPVTSKPPRDGALSAWLSASVGLMQANTASKNESLVSPDVASTMCGGFGTRTEINPTKTTDVIDVDQYLPKKNFKPSKKFPFKQIQNIGRHFKSKPRSKAYIKEDGQ